MRQIMLNYAFRIFRLIIIICSISYFIGTLWYIFTWQLDLMLNPSNTNEDFYENFNFNNLNNENQDMYR